MYLIGHNATLTEILAPAIPADTAKGIAGQPQTSRWVGQAQAYIDEDISDQVRGGGAGPMRVQISQTLVDLPANLPVWPHEEDLITIVRLPLTNFAPQAPQQENLLVRRTDGGLLMLGKLRLYVVRS